MFRTALFDPTDVFRHPWQWQEIPWEKAALRSNFVPVVAVSNINGIKRADVFSRYADISVSFMAMFGTRFYTQIGTGKAPTAVSPVAKTMSLSAAGADFIGKGYENPAKKGFDKKTGRYAAYDDQLGYPTIGYGHLIKRGEDFSKGLSPDQVQDLLRADLKKYVDGVNKQLKVGVSQNQFDAIVSLDFNVGLAGKDPHSPKKHPVFLPRQPVQALNAGKAVTEEDFTAYSKAHDKHHGNKFVTLPGLLKRRKAEWDIFCKNVYDSRH